MRSTGHFTLHRAMLTSLPLVASLAMSATLASAAPATPEEVDALVDRIPVLDLQEKGCPAFIARGSMPMPVENFDYELVYLGKEFRLTYFDSETGLPTLIETRREFAPYDLQSAEFYRLPGGRIDISVTSGEGARLATTRMGYADDSGAAPGYMRFDIRDAVAAAREQSFIDRRPDGSVQLTQKVTADQTRVLLFPPPPSRNLSFGQLSAREKRYTSFHELLLDGIDLKDPALAMPDFERAGIRRMANVADLLPTLSRMEVFHHMPAIQAGIRGNQQSRDAVSNLNLEWDDLRDRDRERRDPWLKLLNGLGVTLSPPAKPWMEAPVDPLVTRTPNATTQPVPEN